MPLNKLDIAKFKSKLEELRAQLLHSVKDTTAQVKNPQEMLGYSQHQADQGTDDFDRTLNLQLTSQEFNVLKQIDRALEKIQENNYGICDLTGEEIPKARLEAIPYATMTVRAQEKFEKGLI